MTNKKVLKGIHVMIRHDNLVVKRMNQFILEWTTPNEAPDIATKAAMMMRSFCNDDLAMLSIIKRQLESSKTFKKCKHPKKSRDIDPDGNPYCVDCNEDL